MRIFAKSISSRLIQPLMCERCIGGDEALYLVTSDVINIRVCAACAEEARKLGLTVASRQEVPERSAVTSLAREGWGFQMKLGKLLGAITACLAVCVIYSCPRMLHNLRNMRPYFLRLH